MPVLWLEAGVAIDRRAIRIDPKVARCSQLLRTIGSNILSSNVQWTQLRCRAMRIRVLIFGYGLVNVGSKFEHASGIVRPWRILATGNWSRKRKTKHCGVVYFQG